MRRWSRTRRIASRFIEFWPLLGTFPALSAGVEFTPVVLELSLSINSSRKTAFLAIPVDPRILFFVSLWAILGLLR